jgi:O-acetyl-ADP-ribose deacetylase (regulator of RNase III)
LALFVEKKGNIFNSESDVIVVTVNCLGFMGKGMALECSLRYPEIETAYKLACKHNLIRIGAILWDTNPKNQYIALFPTKNDYKRPSKVEYIVSGLDALVSNIQNREISSVALPRLGAELGGLDWNLIRPMVEKAVEPLPIEVEFWEFASSIPDPLIASILDYAIELSLQTGLKKSLIDSVVRQSGYREFSSAVDLLSIEGLGKQGVKRLMSWSYKKFEGDATLF